MQDPAQFDKKSPEPVKAKEIKKIKEDKRYRIRSIIRIRKPGRESAKEVEFRKKSSNCERFSLQHC